MKQNSMIFAVLFFFLTIVCNAESQTRNDLSKTSDKSEQESDKQIKNKPLEILKKPSSNGSRSCPEGLAIVRIKVTFDKSGKVTNAEILEHSSCKNFDNNAVKAAKKIKFKPAVKDGEAVTVVKIVEYQFHLYDKI